MNRIHQKLHALTSVGILLPLMALALSGCLMVGPDYEPIKPKVPDTWTQTLLDELASDSSSTAQ